MPTASLFALRTACPPGACDCGHATLEQTPHADHRILLLTREEEKRLVQRIENAPDLATLRHLQQLMLTQLGIQLTMQPGTAEVRSVRGLVITLAPQPGLCRKTRQAIPAAIRKAMERQPQILFALLDEDGLFSRP